MDGARAHRLLVVEDDLGIATELKRGLKARGYEVTLATDGEGLVARVLADPPDLIVLDLMLPGVPGLDVLKDLRGRSPVPVIVLTARTALPHRLEAFSAGAADYLAKPFYLEELVARIEARLGRVGDAPRTLGWGAVELHLDARNCRVNGQDAGLTPHEFNVLAWLAARPGRAATRAQLVAAALSPDGDTSERTLDSHIARIRKKLGPDGAAVATVWGVGYRFDPNAAP